MATANGVAQASSAAIRVLYILDSFPDPHAGTEGQFWLLLSSLDRSRIQPGVLLLRRSAFLERALVDVPLRVLDVTSLRSLPALWRIIRAAWRARADGYRVAHIFFNDSAVVFPPFLKLFGVRVIVSRRDLGFWYTRGNLPLLRFNRWFVDAVVANCNAVKQVVLGKERYRDKKVRVIYNGIKRDSDAMETVVDTPQLPADARSIVLVANLRPLKRIEDAIRALALIAQAVPQANLLIVGGEDSCTAGAAYRAHLQALAASSGIAQRVHFLGKLADPMPIVRRADICVLCSETEGLSNSLIEYMLAAKAIVCTDAGGNAELVENRESGVVIPIGDVERLSSALRELLENEDLRRRFGARARERALSMFATQRMYLEHLSIYREVMGARP